MLAIYNTTTGELVACTEDTTGYNMDGLATKTCPVQYEFKRWDTATRDFVIDVEYRRSIVDNKHGPEHVEKARERKFQFALLYKQGGIIAPVIQNEANIRSMAVDDLCDLIIANRLALTDVDNEELSRVTEKVAIQ